MLFFFPQLSVVSKVSYSEYNGAALSVRPSGFPRPILTLIFYLVASSLLRNRGRSDFVPRMWPEIAARHRIRAADAARNRGERGWQRFRAADAARIRCADQLKKPSRKQFWKIGAFKSQLPSCVHIVWGFCGDRTRDDSIGQGADRTRKSRNEQCSGGTLFQTNIFCIYLGNLENEHSD